MVSTPKTPNKIVNDSKVNIMSQYRCDPSSLLGYLDRMGDEFLKSQTSQAGTPPFEQFASSVTTPSSFSFDTTPQNLSDPFFSDSYYTNDSFYSNESFIDSSDPIFVSSSPSIDPALGFFPELSIDPSSVQTRSLMQLTAAIPSVTIPVDDITSPLTAAIPDSLTIPWSDTTGTTSTEAVHVSSPSMLSSYSSAANSPKTPSTVLSAATSPSSASPSTFKSSSRTRKRSIEETDKDPQIVADELALKRAKNTDAARRSRLRKVMKMETLEKKVSELKAENGDLQTRIAVLESEKKGLEDKNAEKDARVKMLEQQLAEAHERLIKRS